MKYNYVAKHAQRSGSGFHTEKYKPEIEPDPLMQCWDCDHVFHGNEGDRCEKCGSKFAYEMEVKW